MVPTAFINSVQSSELLKAPIIMNGKPIEFVLDSGAEVTVINFSAYKAIGRPQIQSCPEEARFFDGTRCKFLGRGVALFQFDGIQTEQQYYVAKNGTLNLLGMATLDRLGFLEEMKRKIGGKYISQISTNNSAKIKDIIAKFRTNMSNFSQKALGFVPK